MKTHLNLLPWNCRRTQLIRLCLKRWSVPWAVACGLTAAAAIVRWDQAEAARARMEVLEQQYAPTAALRGQIERLGKRFEGLRSREAILDRLEDPRPALSLLGLVSRSARECQGRLRIEQLALRLEGQPGSGPGPTPAHAGATRSVLIKGTAADNLAVARFVLALRRTEAFDRVELKSSQQQPQQGETWSYVLDCAY